MLSRVLAALGIAVWSFFVLSAALALATSPGSWIVAIGIGVVAPIVLMSQVNKAISLYEERGRAMPGAADKEGELLRALEERVEITPAVAAMRTSLTVDQASKMLEKLAKAGHLELRMEDGVIAYALMERDRRELPEAEVPAPKPGGETPQPLDDPLSEREREVLALLSSGRTNAEIAADLFVALGTVKAHVNNIYRKLGARNRAEALAKSRSLGLLP